jgi:hypothetical protein
MDRFPRALPWAVESGPFGANGRAAALARERGEGNGLKSVLRLVVGRRIEIRSTAGGWETD